jgi:hypothetical protein
MRPNPEGQFQAVTLTPDEYKVFAWPSPVDLTAAFQDPEFLQRYESRGYALTIRPSITIDNIKLDQLH